MASDVEAWRARSRSPTRPASRTGHLAQAQRREQPPGQPREALLGDDDLHPRLRVAARGSSQAIFASRCSATVVFPLPALPSTSSGWSGAGADGASYCSGSSSAVTSKARAPAGGRRPRRGCPGRAAVPAPPASTDAGAAPALRQRAVRRALEHPARPR